MYGKLHASAFTGSMRGAGATRFAVWSWIIANTNQHHVVEINPDIVAFMIGCTVSEVEESVAFLCAPDGKSRSKNDEGRRLLREGEFQYLVPQHEFYRKMQTTEEKREYNRVKQQESRMKKRPVKPLVKNVNDVVQADASASKSDSVLKGESEGRKNLPSTPEALRVAALFRRKPSTEWTQKEMHAFKDAHVHIDELDALERYYKRERDKGPEGVHRRDLGTFLRNYRGEYDRALNESAPKPKQKMREI